MSITVYIWLSLIHIYNSAVHHSALLVSVHINPELVVFGRVFDFCGQKIVCDAVVFSCLKAYFYKLFVMDSREYITKMLYVLWVMKIIAVRILVKAGQKVSLI